ncbi:MAG: hypothetical protein IJ342_06070, partial [Muribaculaceae bacterium]|nr:hypothetical protein [Muribaculaceae bacterium]
MTSFTNILLAVNATWLTLSVFVAIFLIINLMLVAILLVAKKYLVHSGNVEIDINNNKKITTASGKTLLATMSENGVFLSSACGGKG